MEQVVVKKIKRPNRKVNLSASQASFITSDSSLEYSRITDLSQSSIDVGHENPPFRQPDNPMQPTTKKIKRRKKPDPKIQADLRVYDLEFQRKMQYSIFRDTAKWSPELRGLYQYCLPLEFPDYCSTLAVGCGVLLSSIWPLVTQHKHTLWQAIEDLIPAYQAGSKVDKINSIKSINKDLCVAKLKEFLSSFTTSTENDRALRKIYSVNPVLMKALAGILQVVLVVWSKAGAEFDVFYPDTQESRTFPIVHILWEEKSISYVLIPKVLSDNYLLEASSSDQDTLMMADLKTQSMLLYNYPKADISSLTSCKDFLTEVVNPILNKVRSPEEGKEPQQDNFVKLNDFKLIKMHCGHFIEVKMLLDAMADSTAQLYLTHEFEDYEEIKCSICSTHIGHYDKLRALGVRAYELLKGVDQRRSAYIAYESLKQCKHCFAFKKVDDMHGEWEICMSCVLFKIHLSTALTSDEERSVEAKKRAKCSTKGCTYKFVLNGEPKACPKDCTFCMKCKNDFIEDGCRGCGHRYLVKMKKVIKRFYPSCRICKKKLIRSTRACKCTCSEHKRDMEVCTYCGIVRLSQDQG